MSLWIHWWNAICLLRPAYTRTRSFMWFATAVAGLTVRTEMLGVTSIVRALKLHPRFYDRLFIQAGLVSQGLVQYLAVVFPQLVWASFGSWLRTIRPGIPPSELVVATALRQCLPQFLLDTAESNSFAKFIIDRQDPHKMELFRLAG